MAAKVLTAKTARMDQVRINVMREPDGDGNEVIRYDIQIRGENDFSDQEDTTVTTEFRLQSTYADESAEMKSAVDGLLAACQTKADDNIGV